MEWLGILLLYAISGYMKKRNKDAKNREIELDPDWDGQEESFGQVSLGLTTSVTRQNGFQHGRWRLPGFNPNKL